MVQRRKRRPKELVAGSEWMLATYERSGDYLVPRGGLQPYALLEQYMTQPRAGRATGPHTEFASIRIEPEDFVALGANDFVSDELAKRVLEFVNRWGLLGIMWSGLQRCEFATDDRGWMLLAADPPPGAPWVVSRGGYGRAANPSPPQRGLLQYAPDVRYGDQLLMAAQRATDPWLLPNLHFPELVGAAAVPAPDSPEVFECYGEYLGDIVRELLEFQRVYAALGSTTNRSAALGWVNAQLRRVSATLVDDRVGWAVDSLLDAMYLMVALDIAAARLPRSCARPGCGGAFMATRSNTRYCGDGCRFANNQRAYRDRQRSDG